MMRKLFAAVGPALLALCAAPCLAQIAQPTTSNYLARRAPAALPVPFVHDSGQVAGTLIQTTPLGGCDSFVVSQDTDIKLPGTTASHRVVQTTSASRKLCFSYSRPIYARDLQNGTTVLAVYMDKSQLAGTAQYTVTYRVGSGGSTVYYGSQNHGFQNISGWQWIAIPSSELSQQGPAIDNADPNAQGLLYITFTTQPGFQGTYNFGPMMFHAQGRPKLMLTYDDRLNTQYDFLRPMLNGLGLKATFFTGWSLTSGQARTDAQDWQLALDGHQIGMDGDAGDLNLTVNYPTPAAAVSAMVAQRTDALTNHHYPFKADDLNFFSYSLAAFNIIPTAYTATNFTSDGAANSTLTLSAANANVKAGMTVHAVGLPDKVALPTVASVSGTTVTLNGSVPAAAGGTTAVVAFRDETGPFFDRALPDALLAAGIKLGRGTGVQASSATGNATTYTRFLGMMDAVVQPSANTVSGGCTAFKSAVDAMIAGGFDQTFIEHNIGSGSYLSTPVADESCKLSYVALKKYQGLLDVMTESEYWYSTLASPTPLPAMPNDR